MSVEQGRVVGRRAGHLFGLNFRLNMQQVGALSSKLAWAEAYAGLAEELNENPAPLRVNGTAYQRAKRTLPTSLYRLYGEGQAGGLALQSAKWPPTILTDTIDPHAAETALVILRKRDSRPTDVRLTNGRLLRVFNVAWGRDLGDEYDHVTTNVSPEPHDDPSIDFFFTNEIVALIDPETGRQIFPRK